MRPIWFLVAILVLLQVFLQGEIAYAQKANCEYGPEIGILAESLHHRSSAETVERIESALNTQSFNKCERALLHSFVGHQLYELDDFDSVIEHFQAAIASGGLADDDILNLKGNIAQLKIANGDYLEGVEMLSGLVEQSGQDNPEYEYLIMVALIQAEEFEAALPYVEAWFDEASPLEREHYDLLNFIYSDQLMLEKQDQILQEMLARWPQDQRLWDQWVAVLTEQGKDAEVFEVHKILYLNGMMDEEFELLQFIDLYHDYGLPFQAAEILDREISSGRISGTTENFIKLSMLYDAAKETTIALRAFEKGARLTESPDIWLDYGQALCKARRFQDGEDAFLTAVTNADDSMDIWREIAKCRYGAAQEMPKPSCDGRSYGQAVTLEPRFVQNQKTIEAYENIALTSRYYSEAQERLVFLAAENERYETRCQSYSHPHGELCIIALENAYNFERIRGGFYLDKSNEHCMAYKSAYDEMYRDP